MSEPSSSHPISLVLSPGKPEPYGVSRQQEGTNFTLYAQKAVGATLLLFSYPEKKCIAEVPLDPSLNRTGDVWHISVEGLPSQTTYGWRLDVPDQPSFCHSSLLLDPYAKSIVSPIKWDEEPDNFYLPLGAVLPELSFDWEGDKPLQLPLNELVIYEMHIRGWTQDPSSSTHHPGTFLGAIEKIPHLLDLKVNAVKLMPLQEFNEKEYRTCNPKTGKRLCNYWGYSTVNYFSPMNRYATKEGLDQAVNEFKTLVKALHQNGIEVILDIVFNHTAESNEKGPVYSFKGIDSHLYYLMTEEEKFLNFTGCGNTVNCNHPIVREWIRNCLKYWVTEMHVDGFRFDLAGIFMRGSDGELLENSPLIEELSHDPVLASTKLIAEPWDSAGLYGLGSFYPNEFRWLEWNDQYRDSVRRFIKGDRKEKKEFASRLSGSEDIFWKKDSPLSSINFITAHDGFTLRDLVSYSQKNNFENGENNQDGNSNNLSWNCGADGDTDDLKVLELREKQRRNFVATLFLSQGIPMILMGDECGHTRFGNNNAWCQDNTLNWFSWDLLEKDREFYRFFKKMIRFRHHHSILSRSQFLDKTIIDWHGEAPFKPDWDGESSFLAFTLKGDGYSLYAAFNPQNKSLKITIPEPSEGEGEEEKGQHTSEKHNGEKNPEPHPESHKEKRWKWVFNTANLSPEDFYEEEQAPFLEASTHEMAPYSCFLLIYRT